MDEHNKIVDEAGKEGAIYFRDSLGQPFEYHGDPEKTRSAYRGDWFTLGDIGYADDDGFLFLTERQSNMIISGGVNIYPQEAENCLMAHPEVYDVAVIGVPDDDMGEQVKAIVIPATPEADSGDAVGPAPPPESEGASITYGRRHRARGGRARMHP